MALEDRDYMRSNSGSRLSFPKDWLDPVTVLLVVNGIVFFLQHICGVAVSSRGELGGVLTLDALMEGKVWTLVTHFFVHTNPWHLLFDGLVLFSVGRSLQSLIGGTKFLYFFFLTGLVGDLADFCLSRLASGPASEFVAFGCTPSVFGVFVGMSALLPRQEITKLVYMLLPLRTRLWSLACAFLAASLFLGILQLFWPAGMGILEGRHFAHLGGALAGWLFVRLLGYSSTPASYDQIRRERQERDRNREFAAIPRKQRVLDLDEPDNTLIPPVTTREFIEREIDPILEKIHAHGIESLTVEERRLLERGRKEILDRKG